jgi:hypothetical protein
VVPVGLASLLLDESFFGTAYAGLPLLACLGLLLVGASVLARSRVLLAITGLPAES